MRGNQSASWGLTALAGAMAVVLSGCPGNDGPDDNLFRVGPAGGSFTYEGVTLDIPKGAVAQETEITVTATDTGIPEVPGRKRISRGFRFSPAVTTFAVPVKLSLPYDPAKVPLAVDPGTFDMRRQGGSDAYLALAGGTTDTAASTFTADTERLGLFWVTSPTQAAVSTLTLDPKEAALAVGQTQQFTARVTDPTGAEIQPALVWTVAPPRVASVDANGLVTALAPGTATLTVSTANLTATAQLRVPGSAVGPSTFVHENPFPTGNDLWGGSFAAGTAFFVGDNATVLARAGDGSFTRLFSSPALRLRGLAGTSQSDAVAIGAQGNTGVLIELKGGASPAVATFTTIDPRALWFDGTHGMAVGYGDDVLVRRNGAWVREYSPSAETLLSVIGDGQGSFVTVGSRGSIYKYDPATEVWNSLYQTQLATLLVSAALVDANGSEAWAAGGGKLWRFSANSWSAINLPGTPVVDELLSLGRIDGRIVVGARAGKQGQLLLYEPGAQTWTSVAMRGPQLPRAVFPAGGAGYAVGDLGAIWQYGAGTFTEVSQGFYGDVADVALTADTVYAGANECVDAACTARQGVLMLKANGGAWTAAAAPPFTAPITAVAARENNEVVVSTTNSGTFRFDGALWSQLSTVSLLDLRFCGNTLWGVGANGTALRGTAGGLSSAGVFGIDPLTAIHCPTATNVWLAGDGALYESTNGTSFTPRTSQAVIPAFWWTVWSPGPGEAFVFGDARYGLYWDSRDYQVVDAPGGVLPDLITGLWGSSIDNLYAVGSTVTPLAFGYAVRFDGASWRLVDAGSQRPLTSIAGRSGTDIWLGGRGGGVLKSVAP